MPLISVDVESDGQAPGLYSMVSFGAVLVKDMNETFYGKTAPISENYNESTLKFLGITREEHETYDDPYGVMIEFDKWLNKISKSGRPIFISDNPAFDWQFINYYFWKYLGRNPFGYSARRISDLYCGLTKNAYAKWKYLRKTKHTHNPVDDAMGNAEVIHHMINNMGLYMRL